ncbi:MAG: hypothetical protein L6E13_07130 [Firmicutes bacterium]|nr:hypothetical protein [Bacillota bacterium]
MAVVAVLELDLLRAVRELRAAFLAGLHPDTDGLLDALARLTGSAVMWWPGAGSQPPNQLGNDETLVVPVEKDGRQLGALLLTRAEKPYGEAEQLLAEHVAALLAVLQAAAERQQQAADEGARQAARLAAGSLSETERQGMMALLAEYKGPMTVRLKEVAARAGVHPSALVQALAKLRAAGVITAVSRGRRGVHVTVLNPWLLEELRPAAVRRG